MKVALVSLGCSRTLVDSEVALGGLAKAGHQIVQNVSGADVGIVNTCGFIEDAKKESIDAILELCALKKKGKLKAVVVLGCLAQRYGPELQKEIREADAIIGTNNYGDLAKVLEGLQDKQTIFEVKPKPYYLLDENSPRYSLTPDHFAYVKISEGCINACSYCMIPKMKGAHRSRSVESIVLEIKKLAGERSLSEVNLVGQDTAAFGYDKDKTFQLPRLLREINKEKSVPWLRLLYAHPGHVTDELIDAIAESETLCKYVDFPIEHSHDAMLKRMNRGVDRKKMEWGIKTLRDKIPGVGIRTTVIVGFPGETEEEFRDLMGFLKEARFERLGAFMFSAEEGARAYHMPDPIPKELKQERFHEVMEQQKLISEEISGSFIGREIRVLIDKKNPDEKNSYTGRTQWDAPEVDGEVIVESERTLRSGQFVDVKITDALEYDLIATTCLA